MELTTEQKKMLNLLIDEKLKTLRKHSKDTKKSSISESYAKLYNFIIQDFEELKTKINA